MHRGCNSEQHRPGKFPSKTLTEDDADVIGLQKMIKKTHENIHHDHRVARGSTFAIHRDNSTRGGCDALATVRRSSRKGQLIVQMDTI